MKTLIKGDKYNFLVKCYKSNNLFCFYIKATSTKGYKYSYINNLNGILSAFDIDIDDYKVAESQWVLNKKEANNFFKKAADFLADSSFVNYIEKQLDLDRELGQWNKIKI